MLNYQDVKYQKSRITKLLSATISFHWSRYASLLIAHHLRPEDAHSSLSPQYLHLQMYHQGLIVIHAHPLLRPDSFTLSLPAFFSYGALCYWFSPFLLGVLERDLKASIFLQEQLLEQWLVPPTGHHRWYWYRAWSWGFSFAELFHRVIGNNGSVSRASIWPLIIWIDNVGDRTLTTIDVDGYWCRSASWTEKGRDVCLLSKREAKNWSRIRARCQRCQCYGLLRSGEHTKSLAHQIACRPHKIPRPPKTVAHTKSSVAHQRLSPIQKLSPTKSRLSPTQNPSPIQNRPALASNLCVHSGELAPRLVRGSCDCEERKH